MNPFCIDQGIGLIPWSPLARGFLSGNRTKADMAKDTGDKQSATMRAQSDVMSHRYFYTDNDFQIVERVKTMAEEKQIKPAQLALAWILAKPGVSAPIIGASKMYQLEEAVAATSIQLTADEITKLEELYQSRSILGHS